MNHSGAVKVTEYLGKFLDENYHLPDHRGENGFEQWANDLAEYKKTIGEIVYLLYNIYRLSS